MSFLSNSSSFRVTTFFADKYHNFAGTVFQNLADITLSDDVTKFGIAVEQLSDSVRISNAPLTNHVGNYNCYKHVFEHVL